MGSTIDLLERSAVGEAVVVTARWIDFGGTDQAHTRHGEPLGDIRHVHRLFPLLKAHGLGMEPSTGHHWQEGGTCVVEVRRETMARIAAIVGPPGRLQPAR